MAHMTFLCMQGTTRGEKLSDRTRKKKVQEKKKETKGEERINESEECEGKKRNPMDESLNKAEIDQGRVLIHTIITRHRTARS